MAPEKKNGSCTLKRQKKQEGYLTFNVFGLTCELKRIQKSACNF